MLRRLNVGCWPKRCDLHIEDITIIKVQKLNELDNETRENVINSKMHRKTQRWLIKTESCPKEQNILIYNNEKWKILAQIIKKKRIHKGNRNVTILMNADNYMDL